MERELERFIEYVKINTRANPRAKERPSSPGQRVLANLIREELREIGLARRQVIFLEDGSLFVSLGPDCGFEKTTAVVFSAHLDTYFEIEGKARPIIHRYVGGDIELGNNIVIPEDELAGLSRKRIVTADGTSLLGADNKSAVAALVTVIERIVKERIPHGPLFFWFCTDEELGRNGFEFLPKSMVEKFDVFWTFDGRAAGVIDVGCFNGAEIMVTFKGSDAHAGIEGSKLNPAHYAAGRFFDSLGRLPSPWSTAGLESFYYAFSDSIFSPTLAAVRCWPRTFNFKELNRMASVIRKTAIRVAKDKEWDIDVDVEIGPMKILFVNTANAIKTKEYLLVPMLNALIKQGFTPVKNMFRGGTDGARINTAHPKLPAPNLGTGSYNIHGLKEFLVVDGDFITVVPTVIGAVEEYARLPFSPKH